MKRLLAYSIISLFFSVVLLTSMTALADPPTLPDGPVYFQFNNMEQIDTSLGNAITVPGGPIDIDGDGTVDTPASEGNWGIFNVSTIQKGGISTPHNDISGGQVFHIDDGPGGTFGQVSGIFYGITTLTGTTATGGWIDFYWEDAGADDIVTGDLNGGFLPSARTAANMVGKFTDGGIFLGRLAFASGITPGDTTTFIKSSSDISSGGLTGWADSFLNVVDINNDGVIDADDGAWAAQLNGDWFFVDDDNDGIFGEPGETRDMRLSTFYNQLAAWDDPNGSVIAGLRSNDPARVYVTTYEEAADCRVTAGGNKDGITVPCELKANGMPDVKTCADEITHTWGGQAGAQPGVDGNWTHHYILSNKDSFVFHSNDLFNIVCSDPGPYCEPARPADTRQIDFYGIGKFNNTKGEFEAFPQGDLCFHVHLEDLGEPGQGGKWPVSVAEGLDCEHCPGTPIINGDPSDLSSRSDCRDCTDYYLIEIYDSGDNNGVECTGDVLWVNGAPDDDGRCGAGDPQLEGFFTRAGNVQMHPENN